MNPVVIAALYKFVTLANYRDMRLPILNKMSELGVKGTLLLASEGINGTVSGTREGIDGLLVFLRSYPELADIHHKESYEAEQPFYRSKVKLKREIVTMGVEGIDPKKVVGTYVKPKDWNKLISDPDVTVIDTRNNYEYQVGTFDGALNPNTSSFREFPVYVEQELKPERHKKVAMFCTGGIRCEKSTAYLREQGFQEVYHLEGGILKYLEEVKPEESLWRGECFVFDNRVTVNHSLDRGSYEQCHGCRMPITEADMESHLYVRGVSCPHCHDRQTPEQKLRFSERQKQIDLARERRQPHLGAPPPARQLRTEKT